MKLLVNHAVARQRDMSHNSVPCTALVPDFMLTLISAPAAWPMLASNVAV